MNFDDHDTYPLGKTVDNGRYVFTSLLGGVPVRGWWAGQDRKRDNRLVMMAISPGYKPSNSERSILSYDISGIAPVLFIGQPDGHAGPEVKNMAGWYNVVVEAKPPGQNLLSAGRLTANEVICLGLSLSDTVLCWGDQGEIHRGLRPDTVYIAGSPGLRTFSGATPRIFISLGNDGMFHAFCTDWYAPPSDIDTFNIDVDDEIFVVGLLMWFALLGEHPYRKMPGHPYQHDNIWEDIRHPFSGPAELGRLLEAVLVADPDRRMSAREFRDQLAHLARAWDVDLPPFPPPGLAELAD